MTAATITRPRNAPSGQRKVTQGQVIASEWIKLRSLRSSWFTFVAAIVGMIGIGLLVSAVTNAHWGQLGPDERAHFDPVTRSLTGVYLAQLAVGVLGVLVISGEYATGMIRATFGAVPTRLPVLWAKLAVFAAVTFVLMLISSFVAFLGGQQLLTTHGTTLGAPNALRAVVGVALYLTVVGALGIALGFLIRSTAGGIATLFGLLLVLPTIGQVLPASWQVHILPYLPGNAGAALFTLHPDPGDTLPVDRIRGVLRMGGRGAAGRVGPDDEARRLIDMPVARPPRPGLSPGGADALAADALSGQPPPLWPAVSGRLRALRKAHPWLVDSLLVAALEVITLIGVVHRGGNVWWIGILDQALILPLVLRRRSPSGVFAFLAAVALIQWLAGERLPSDLSLLIALYTVAAHQPRRRALLAAAVLEIGVVLAAARFAPAGGVLGSLIFLSGLVATALFSGMTLRTRRAYLAFVVDRALRLERERDQQARLAATAERTRIAREMHDIVAHSLSVMVTLADGAAAAHATDPHQSVSAMRDVSATGRQALTEMRRLLGVLRDDDDTAADAQLAPPPGLPQLDELVSQVRGTGLPVQLTMTGQPAAMPPAQQTVVYRVVQEALTNAIKHGRDVSEVRVSLRWTDGRVEVTVTDDGAPCAEGAASQSPGHGLTGMRERVSLYGGQVDAGPRSMGGWRVHAQLGVDRAVDR